MLTLVLVLSLVSIVRSEEGSCPPTLPVDLCDPSCGPQSKCPDNQLCCPTSCGGAMCVDAVTKRRTFTVKPGHCPSHPRGVWICTDTCTVDADCKRRLKCCPNRCGALACQLPEVEDPAPETNSLS